MRSKSIRKKINKLGENRVFCRVFLITLVFLLIFFSGRGLVVDLTLVAEAALFDFVISECSKKRSANVDSRNLNITSNNEIELKKLNSGISKRTEKDVKKRTSRIYEKRKKSKGCGWLLLIIFSFTLILTLLYEGCIINLIFDKGIFNELGSQENHGKVKYLAQIHNSNPPINLPIPDFSNWLLTNWNYRHSLEPSKLKNINNSIRKGIKYLETEFDTFIGLQIELNSTINGSLNSNFGLMFSEEEKDKIEVVVNSEFGENDKISIVIPAHNEDEFITKTVLYTIEATPKILLGEIIIVDDSSDTPIINILENEIPEKYRKYIRVIRLNKCEGLIRSKIIGADAAISPNIFFLDGHCRPKKGWSEALVRSIRENYKRIVCPIVQSISHKDWSDIGTAGAKMMIEWNFAFHWYDDGLPEIPITSGGILMITKRWWEESGKYDPGMLYWGGENIEQSFRVWLCGGEIHVVRNSLVGHIFERKNLDKRHNIDYNRLLIDNMNLNHQRTAYVWLSEQYYETYFRNFHVLGYMLTNRTNGLAERLAIRNQLNCKPFEWYVRKFKPAFERQYELQYEFHHIQHVKSRLCLSIQQNGESNKYGKPINIKVEIPMTVIPNDISKYNIKTTTDFDILTLRKCSIQDDSQKWSFILGNRMIYNRLTRRCLDRKESNNLIKDFKNEFEIQDSENKSDKINDLKLPILFECDWNLVMRARNSNQFWAWKNSDDNGIVISWDGNEHKSNITGGADEFVVPENKDINIGSYCLYSSSELGNHEGSHVFYRNCSKERSENFIFRKLWRQHIID
ncbi:glycosyl transferase [Cryptosporidium felis]|nr:glycosyl transferase [Cryptosporidium felis]